jgi:HK97 family phage major capsid protein
MKKDLQKLKDERGELVTLMRAMHEKAEKEERAFSSDEDSTWNKMDARLEEIDANIKRAEKLDKLGAPVPSELRGAPRFTGEHSAGSGGEEEELTETRVFDRFLRVGMGELSSEERTMMQERRNNAKELRAFGQGTGNAGGFTVPQDFRAKLEVALKAYGGMMDAAEIIYTDTGATLPMPSFNYTAVVATIVGENTAGGLDSSTPFGVANLGAFTYRSPILPVSYEFLQDSAFGEDFIVNGLSDSIARALNAHATVGTGTGQPRGIMLDAAAGKVGATGQTTSIVFEDLIDLVHSIDPAYRKSGCSMMMHDQSLKAVRKIKDNQGRPIYLPAYDGLGGPMGDQIMGYGVVVNQDVAQMAANAKSIAFGRLDKYKIRMVKDITVMRLTERYADALQVAFLLFARADGRLLDAGTNPVKYYQNSAT